MSIPHIPFSAILIAIVAFVVFRRVYFELTTGARRRQMIKQNGCEEAKWYPHKGIMGNLFGLDLVKDMIESGREGRLNEASRIRSWSDGKFTMKLRLPMNTRKHPLMLSPGLRNADIGEQSSPRLNRRMSRPFCPRNSRTILWEGGEGKFSCLRSVTASLPMMAPPGKDRGPW